MSTTSNRTEHTHGRTSGVALGLALGVTVFLSTNTLSRKWVAADEPKSASDAGKKAAQPDATEFRDDDIVAAEYRKVVDQVMKRFEFTGEGELTNRDVPKWLHKTPEFSGHPGQIQLNSSYYEAFVWRSKSRTNFIAPPQKPELLDMFAIFSGEVAPHLVKYRTKGLDKNRSTPASSKDALVLYVYYGPEDQKTKTREVVDISPTRHPYMDEVMKLPDAAELKKRHEANLARAQETMEKFGKRKLTQAEKDAMDTWKNPPTKTAAPEPKKSPTGK